MMFKNVQNVECHIFVSGVLLVVFTLVLQGTNRKKISMYIYEFEKNLKFLKIISVLICKARHHQGLFNSETKEKTQLMITLLNQFHGNL